MNTLRLDGKIISLLYCFRDGLPQRNLQFDTESKKQRYGYLDPYVNVTGKPFQPKVNNWTYIMSDSYYHTPLVRETLKVFRLSMATILQHMGTLQGVQVV